MIMHAHRTMPDVAWKCLQGVAAQTCEPVIQTLNRAAGEYARKHASRKVNFVGMAAGGVLVGLGVFSMGFGIAGACLMAACAAAVWKRRHANERLQLIDRWRELEANLPGGLRAQCLLRAASQAQAQKDATTGEAQAQAQTTLRSVLDDMDRFKKASVASLRNDPSLERAMHLADTIAAWHNKPDHAAETTAMAQRLFDPALATKIATAARLMVLGEYASPALLMRSGRMTQQERQEHVLPIGDRAAAILQQIPGADAFAEAAAGKASTGLTPHVHLCRDLAALDAPRAWRRDAAHPDGRLSTAEVAIELRNNNVKPGRDAELTEKALATYLATHPASKK